MSDASNLEEDEVDLKELIGALWGHKILIALITSFSIFLSGYYALKKERMYTAKAVFQIEEKNSTDLNISGEFAAIASLAGVGSKAGSNSEALLERISSREFILEISKKTSMASDPAFNSYNPDYKDPAWKAMIKKVIGWQTRTPNKTIIVENSIINNYKKLVKANTTDAGAISVSVTHENPKSAANYANKLMEGIRLLVETENNEAQTLRLSYLSETLADALQDMDNTQKSLKDFVLKNSAAAQENFIKGSLQLDQMRMERNEVQEISEVLEVLENLISAGNLDTSAHEQLRSMYPMVDNVSFRRILGMSETISAWIWPDIETIQAVSTTLTDRIKRLNVKIKTIEENARIYAASAESLAELTRDAKIAEATYTVLIEQVKSQSLAAGFQPSTFKVFEYATPPLIPSSPKRNIILLVGAILGLFSGSGVALFNASRQGFYFTKSALISDTKPNLVSKTKSFKRLCRWPFSKLETYLSEKNILDLDEIELRLANKRLIYVLNCGGRATASGIARLLALQSSNSGRKVVLCDKTGLSEKEILSGPVHSNDGINFVSQKANLDVTTGDNGRSFFTASNCSDKISKLLANYDQVVLCANNKESMIGLLATVKLKPSIVLLTRLRKTRKLEIKKITSNQTVDVLLCD